MGGLFERLNFKNRVSLCGAYLFRTLKRPLTLAWLCFFLLILGAISLTFVLPVEIPITASTTVAFTPAPEEKKAAIQPPAPAPPAEPAFRKNSQTMTVPEGTAVAALVISGLGLDDDLLAQAKQMFPKEVTFALNPGTLNLSQTIKDLRTEGHEVVLMVPMEPLDYPQSDPGPNSLLTSLAPADNVTRLKNLLETAGGVVGVTNFMGEAFVRSIEHVQPVLAFLKEEGYLVLDTTIPEKSEIPPLATELGMQNLLVKTQIFDELTNPKFKSSELSDIEHLAKFDGRVVAYTPSLPKDLEVLSAWVKGLNEKGVLLVPLSVASHYKPLPRKDAGSPAAPPQ